MSAGNRKLLWYGGGALALYLLLRPSTSKPATGAATAATNTGLLGALTNGISQTTALFKGLFGATPAAPPSTAAPAPTDANLNSYASSSGFATVPNVVSTGDGTGAVDA